MSGRIRVGIGGWVFPEWRGSFYPAGLPQKDELRFASRALSSIEINGTFYGSQKPESFRKWHDEAPDGFMFSLKGPRFATNRKDLREAGQSVQRFIESGLIELGDKLGPINWQFAPTKRFDPDEFAAFLDLLPGEANGMRLRHAVELRHESFRCAKAIELARERNVALVLAGDSQYPCIAEPTADFIYARIMGTSDAHPCGYDDAALASWASRARLFSEGGIPPDLGRIEGEAPAKNIPRAVFLYVISGFKARNPAAATALIEKLA